MVTSYLGVVGPLLVAAHSVTAYQLHGPAGVGGVQAVVVGHDLLALGVREHLVAAHAVAVAHAEGLARLPAHSVQTVGRLGVTNLKGCSKSSATKSTFRSILD